MTMFAMPETTVTASPSLGFWAVIKKVWNSYWSMNRGRADNTILP